MQPARAGWTAGRLSSADAPAVGISQGGASAVNPYKTNASAGKLGPAVSSTSSSRPDAFAAGRPAPCSNSDTPQSQAPLELSSLESIKLLLARYPAFGPALQQLDWDEHGRISKPTLLRIISALEGDTLLQGQHVSPAATAVPCRADTGTTGTTGSAASTAGPRPAAAPSTATTEPGATAGMPAQHTDSLAAAWSDMYAAAAMPGSGLGPSSAGAGGAGAAAAPCSTSSAGSSRRASLRPTLSIDISSIHVSDSSDSSGEDGEGSSADEPPAPAPGQHGPGSLAEGPLCAGSGASTHGARAAAAGVDSSDAGAAVCDDGACAGCQTAPQAAAASHAGAAGVLSAASGGRKKHRSTPGYVLHGPSNIFSNPMADGAEDEGSEDEAAPAPPAAAARAGHAACRGTGSDSDGDVGARAAQQQKVHTNGSRSGRKAQTPATGLGKPVSIFGGEHTRGHGDEQADSRGVQHQHAAGGKVKQQQKQQQKQQRQAGHAWQQKLSKRPPTPGVSLSQPISIFSASGSSMETGITYSDPSSSHPDDEYLLSFVQPPACGTRPGPSSGSSGDSTAGQRHRPQSAPQLPCRAPQPQHGWHQKLSQRPPTPGAALGRPVSIFSSSGADAASDGSDSGEDGTGQLHGQHLVKFADHHGAPLELGPGPAASSSRHASASGAAGAATAAAPSVPRHSRQQQAKQAQRPAAAGISFAQPVAFLSGDAGSRRSGGAAHAAADGGHEGHVSFGPPPAHLGSDSGGAGGSRRSSSSAGRATTRSSQGGGAAAYAGKAQSHAAGAGEQVQPSRWHHKLSQRPPTPGVSVGKPVNIFSAGGSSSGPAEECQQPPSTESSQGCCSEEEGGHVHFDACGAGKEQATAGAAVGEEAVADRPQQHWHHKLSQRPPTPGVSLGQPVSIFSSSGANPADAADAATAAEEPAACSTQQQHSASGRRVSWGEATQEPVNGGACEPHQQQVQHRQQQSGRPAGASCAATGSAGRSSSGGSSSSSSHASKHEGRRISWDTRAPVCIDGSDAASQPGAGRVTWGDGPAAASATRSSGAGQAYAAAGIAAVPAGPRPAVSSSKERAGRCVVFRHTGSDSEAESEQQQQEQALGASEGRGAAVNSSPAVQGSLAGAGQGKLHPAVSAATQQQQQHWRGKAAARPQTPGCALSQRPNSSSGQDEEGEEQEDWDGAGSVIAAGAAGAGADHQAGKQGAEANTAAAAAATGVGRGPGKSGLLARLNPALAAEAAEQKWQQHMSDRPPSPGAPLADRHGIFAAQGSARDSAAPGGKPSRIPPAPGVGHASKGSDGDSSSSSSNSRSQSSQQQGRPSAQQALLKLNPELAAEAAQQQWQQHMANRPPTPGASLLQHNMFAAGDDAGDDAAATGGTVASVQQDLQGPVAAVDTVTGSSSSSSGSSAVSSGAAHQGGARASAAGRGLLKLNPELAAEAAEQQWQQHMAARPPTPGASLLHHQRNLFADTDDAAGAAAAVPPSAAAAVTTPVRATDSSSSSSRPSQQQGRPSALLKLRPEFAAEAAEQKWQQHMANRPPTPGASLLQHNMFSDRDAAEVEAGRTHQLTSSTAATSAAASATRGPSGGSSSSSDSPSGSGRGSGAGGRASAALLKLHPDLAAEAAEQKWQQHMTNRPRTPGASLLLQHNIFADIDEEDGLGQNSSPMQSSAPAAAAAAVLAVAGRQQHSAQGASADPRPDSAAGVLLAHNTELALEKQQQWERSLARRPPTPAAALGQHHNMFADERQEQQQEQRGTARLPSSSNGAVVQGALSLRNRSPDQARSVSGGSSNDNADGGGSSGSSSTPGSPAGSAAPAAPAAPAAAAASSTSQVRPGSSNPGRQRGSSPLRNSTSAAEVAQAEQADRAACSPLRHSSSLCDPDPTRMSPLGRKGSAKGSAGSPLSTAAAAATAAAAGGSGAVGVDAGGPGVMPAAAAVTAGGVAGQPEAVGGQRQGQAAADDVGVEVRSPSRLGRSASPGPGGATSGSPTCRAEEGQAGHVQRSGSPLSRNSSSSDARQAANPVRHGSPLSRSS